MGLETLVSLQNHALKLVSSRFLPIQIFFQSWPQFEGLQNSVLRAALAKDLFLSLNGVQWVVTRLAHLY